MQMKERDVMVRVKYDGDIYIEEELFRPGSMLSYDRDTEVIIIGLADNLRRMQWIEATLLNDETATDEEMTEYFMKEGQCSKEEAEFYVAQRNNALKAPLEFRLKPYNVIQELLNKAGMKEALIQRMNDEGNVIPTGQALESLVNDFTEFLKGALPDWLDTQYNLYREDDGK